MPNIEIHGVEAGRAERIRKKIFEVFEPLREPGNCFDGLVVAICLGTVDNRLYQGQLFFRVYFEPEDDLDRIIWELAPFRLDIETVPLKSFTPSCDYNQDPNDRLERPAERKYEDT